MVETLERTVGHSGELVLRRRRGRLELICGGVFVISEENEESSRALVRAALPQLPARPLDVLIGGLGFGYALDEALATERVRSVTVAELEPAILSWFERYGAGRASRCAADARARILVADVVEVLHERPKSCDLLVLDTDNGPDWLVREANAVLYAEDGVRLAHRALRPAGVAVFWAPAPAPAFAVLLRRTFAAVGVVAAADVVDGRRYIYAMYVCRRSARPASRTKAPQDPHGARALK